MRPFDYLSESYVWEMLVLVGLALVFQFVPRVKALKTDDQYFLMHRTTVVQAALCIVTYTLLLVFFSWTRFALSNPLALDVWKYISLLVVLGFIVISYRLIGQSFRLLGFTTQSSSSALLAGAKAALLVLVLHDLYWLLVPESWLDGQALFHTSPELEHYVREHGMLWSGVAALVTTFSRQGLTALIEELCYRGLLYSALRKHFPVAPALIGSSVIFMLGHEWFGPEVLMFGCLQAYLYETYHSILPAIIVHFSWNAQLNLFGWVMSASVISAKSWYAGSLVLTFVALGIVHYLSKEKGVEHASA